MTMASDEQILLKKWRSLPAEKQQEILDFADYLHQKTSSKRPRRSLLGLAADLHVSITEEDIAQARREMWSDFPRDIAS